MLADKGADEKEEAVLKELWALQEDIQDTVTAPFKLSGFARTVTSRDRYARALAQVDASKVESEEQDVETIGDHFSRLRQPTLSWLRARLGAANNVRRRYLKYCELHRDRLAGGSDDPQLAFETRQTDAGHYDLRRQQAGEDQSNTNRSEVSGSRGETTASTIASGAVDPPFEQDYGDTTSQGSYTSSYSETDRDIRLAVIDLEEARNRMDPFECPYCKVQVSFKNQRGWRKHVFRDLKAYVCTAASCELRMFEDNRTWYRHEADAHLAEWECGYCDLPPFSSCDELSQHLRQQHGSASGNSTAQLAKISRQETDTIPASACRFCDWQTKIRLSIPKAPKTGDINVTPRRYRSHVGSHLEQAALVLWKRNEKNTRREADDTADDFSSTEFFAEEAASRKQDLTLSNNDAVAAPEDHPDAAFLLPAAVEGQGPTRLLNTSSLELRQFLGSQIPAYAILSHRWTQEEVLFEEISKERSHEGLPERYQKVVGACRVAQRHGLDWIWVDTCCIDKRSSAELSEAINSMYAWYHHATACYAYLGDISVERDRSTLRTSSWFTRGWTLQDLIASRSTTLFFYDQDWRDLGTKSSLRAELSTITGIPTEVLESGALKSRSLAERVSWASHRITTRVEDMAYSLLGIFDINMPILYGEGRSAFFRLQQEIIKTHSDPSIFAWQSPGEHHGSGLLADWPSRFASSFDVRLVTIDDPSWQFMMTNRGLELRLRSVKADRDGKKYRIVELGCRRVNITSGLDEGLSQKPKLAGGASESDTLTLELREDHSVWIRESKTLITARDRGIRNWDNEERLIVFPGGYSRALD